MTALVQVKRTARLPDPMRVARCERAPELGPRILFFSGGTALRDVSRRLKTYTHNSIHLITPFDSGGSSAKLRRAFGMLSIGDLRNRLMALADESVRGNPEIYRLFSYRFPDEGDAGDLGRRLRAIINGDHPLIAEIPAPLRRIVCTHLRRFAEAMPWSFDLRGASIGNLVLAGAYLINDGDIDSVVFLFSQLVEARGVVLPVVADNLELAAELADGTTVIGQHRLTGKTETAIEVPVRDLYLAHVDGQRAASSAPERTRSLISEADLVCFPMGSFYSSIVANLLPAGVGSSIVAAGCPKVYVPNMGTDPEQIGMTVANAVEVLLRIVRTDAGDDVPSDAILNYVLLDRSRSAYATTVDESRIRALGVEPVTMDLAAGGPETRVAPDVLSRALVSLI